MSEIVVLPGDSLIHVEFMVALPCGAAKDQIEEWIYYCLDNGSIQSDNPLLKHDLQVIGNVILTDTESRVKIEESEWKTRKDGKKYKTRRYLRVPR